MASQCVVVLSLFLVLVGTTMAEPHPAEYHPISNYDNGEVQFLGWYAVDVNNKMGQPHLIFMQVVSGTVIIPLPFFPDQRIWELDLLAINCSESGSPSKYGVAVLENMFSGTFENQIEAYGSNFTARESIDKY